MTHDLFVQLGMYGGTAAVCLISGLVFFVNSEIYLAWLVRYHVDAPVQLWGIVAAAVAGQMVAKIILYYAGLRMFEVPRGRWKAKIERARARIASWENKPYLIYAASSVFGVPPMYLTVLAAGAMKIRFVPFLAIGAAGRLIRFGVLAAIFWYA